MNKTEIECEIVSKLEKIEKNKNIISEVLTENSNASGSIDMPRPSQKKVVEVMNIVANLENKIDLNNIYYKYKSSAEMLKSGEETYKALEIKATEMHEIFERTEEMYNRFFDESTKPILEIEYENSWLDI